MTMTPGLFGKLPRHGDFLRRGMVEETVRAWDDWLSAGLEQQRQTLGEAFDSTHDSAPCLRFLLREGEAWRVGVVCPSIDGVGRRFFLVLQLDGMAPAAALGQGADLARRIEDLAYGALGDRWDADETMRRLAELLDGLDPLDAAAWSDLGVGATSHGVWWRGPCETAGSASKAGGWGQEGILDMMFERSAGSVAA